MSRKVTPIVMVVCLMLMGAAVAQSALASCTTSGTQFKAFNSTSCSDPSPLIDSNAPVGSTVSVARDQTSSAKNATNNKWCFVNEGINDQTVFTQAPTTANDTLGAANNIVDHFDVVANGSGCPA